MTDEEKELCESLSIAIERKHEILKESYRKYMNGEVNKIPLDVFLERRKEKRKELEKLIMLQEERRNQ